MRALFFDTETTDLPKDWKKDAIAGPGNWPDIVSISWILTDGPSVVGAKSFIVEPEDWVSSPISLSIHKISHEVAVRSGVKLKRALTEFIRDLKTVDIVIAHNLHFDKNVVINAVLYKCLDNPVPKLLFPKYEFCTMAAGRSICKLPPINPNPWHEFKAPRLVEFYKFTYNTLPPMELFHSSLGDIHMTVCIFFKHWTLESAAQIAPSLKIGA
jgi:hypothetical protein